MKASLFLISCLLFTGLTYAAVADIGGLAHGGEGHGIGELGAGDKGGAGYGGRQGEVKSSDYDRGFSYSTGHDTAKTVSVGDKEFGGKGYGDKGMREFGLSGLGYGGLGNGGFRAPLFFF